MIQHFIKLFDTEHFLLIVFFISDITATTIISKRKMSYLTVYIESHFSGRSIFLKTRKRAFVSFGTKESSITRFRVEEGFGPFLFLNTKQNSRILRVPMR